MQCEPATVVADSEITWRLSLTVRNPLAVSLTADSGQVVVEDRGEGELNAPRTSDLPMSQLVATLGTLAPGESRTLPWMAPATVDRGRLTFEIDAHDSLGAAHRLSAKADAEPSAFSKQHPSQLIDVNGRKVEIVYVAPPDSSRPAPGVLLIHGHAHNARHMLRGARMLHQAGYAVMIVSQPGYGLSAGPADFMGPRTIAAASAAFDRLARSSGVDSTRLGAWGISRGATVVTLLMMHRPDVRAGIAQAGVYDMWANYRGTQFVGIRANMVAEIGSDSAAWRERSAALSPEKLKGRLLILHGEADPRVPFGQARAFYQDLKARGAEVEAEFLPGAEHMLPRDRVGERTMEFLSRSLRAAAAVSR
jgi:dipeptidyl aminopeptidase/acylaminoacyl peptidase